MVVNDAVGQLDKESQRRIIANVKQLRGERGIVWVLSRESLANNFKQTLILEKGKVVKQSTNFA